MPTTWWSVDPMRRRFLYPRGVFEGRPLSPNSFRSQRPGQDHQDVRGRGQVRLRNCCGVVGESEKLKPHARQTTHTTQGEGIQRMVGQCTHGGQCGVVNDTHTYLFVPHYLTKAFKELTGVNDFTSILIPEDVGMKCHRDVHNYVGRSNVLLPLLPCEDGGGVWAEADAGAYSFQDEWRPLPNRGWRRGRVHELCPGVPIEINPRRYHATEPWKGRQLVMTTYTPRTSSVKQSTYETLKEYGFDLPPLQPQVPEPLQRTMLRMLSVDSEKDTGSKDAILFLVKEAEEEKRQQTQQIGEELQQLHEDGLGRLKERREWLREFLAEEEIWARRSTRSLLASMRWSET